MNIHTHRIEIRIAENDPEKLKTDWKKMRDLQYHTFRMANDMMTTLYLALQNKSREKAEGITHEKVRGGSDQNIPYQVSKKYKEDVGSFVRSALASKVYADYQNHKEDIFKGNRTIDTYRRTIAIPFVKEALVNVSERGFVFEKIPFEWVLGNREKRGVASKVAAIKSVSQSLEWIGNCQFQIGKRKIYLLMPVKSEKKKRDLPRKVAGIDLGMNVAIYFCTQDGVHQPLGLNQLLAEKRIAIQEKRRKLQSDLTMAKGGHGRGRKLRKVNDWGRYEKEIVTQINHHLSKELIRLCLENDITILRVENLTGFADKSHFESKVEEMIYRFVLRNWGYYDLLAKIKYKAKREGIEIEEVNPEYTTLQCSACGHTSELNLPKITDFLCESCGFEAHADHNAAINICRSEKLKSNVKKPKKQKKAA